MTACRDGFCMGRNAGHCREPEPRESALRQCLVGWMPKADRGQGGARKGSWATAQQRTECARRAASAAARQTTGGRLTVAREADMQRLNRRLRR